MPALQTIDPESSQTDDFISLLTGHQDILLTFIRGSIGDLATAKDILQEVNLILWKKSSQFKMGSNFKAWALKTAQFQILGNYRDKQRSKLVFDPDLVDQLATEASHVDDDWKKDQRLEALEICLQKLPDKQRSLLDSRYRAGGSIKELAQALNSSTSRLKMILFRARKNLRDCIMMRVESSQQGKGLTQ
ncbi:sigma-70 family RNA polymerase sigma factor [Verrucomicrobiaceae bacterium N1E253]|uniref:Sigma-70 family RNA polymerase sigma factor n=1 Tax=Oceaniferula marina TaxID=2748318 RepID=A0A851GG25_9BACT|nr:sigma-70 family RNA polymerase sigma factor [Oceaniferula marina]NWK55862.1 sigma-70 family RNA polymerase sigma factor [Oceaniferula marina]